MMAAQVSPLKTSVDHLVRLVKRRPRLTAVAVTVALAAVATLTWVTMPSPRPTESVEVNVVCDERFAGSLPSRADGHSLELVKRRQTTVSVKVGGQPDRSETMMAAIVRVSDGVVVAKGRVGELRTMSFEPWISLRSCRAGDAPRGDHEVVVFTRRMMARGPTGLTPSEFYELYTHCGIDGLMYQGFWWEAQQPPDDGPGMRPPGWDNPYQRGRLFVLGDTELEFRSDPGTVRFRKTTNIEPPLICK